MRLIGPTIRPITVVRLLVVLVLAACSRSARPPEPASASPATPVPPAVAVTVVPDEPCGEGEVMPDGGARTLAQVSFWRTFEGRDGLEEDSYIDRHTCQTVKRCFELIPQDTRSVDRIYEVIVDTRGDDLWSGVKDGYPPKYIQDDAFTRCTTDAILEWVRTTKETGSVRYRVTASTHAAMSVFSGSLGHGSGHP